MLMRYKGPLVALKGAIGRLLPSGRVALAGREVEPAGVVERPRYWALADAAWSGPYTSWEAAAGHLADVLRVWGETDAADATLAAEATPEGWTHYAAGCRLRIVPGGDVRPC